ncbi:MAG: molybdopterin molybdotransferase MoeA [Helicobacteraceae bacterium]|jgi:molybdopterin molybdotransferase|nr:molybdopterin molybdotransferase MoeA [Helicobacteraceae bacterium]
MLPAIADALKIMLECVTPIARAELVSLSGALGRILAADVAALRDLPPYDNSAMDGYAVKLTDAGKAVKVAGAIFAGDEPNAEVSEGSAVKIMTGAMIPNGAEAVVMVEDTRILEGGLARLPEKIAADQHIRFAGEEIKEGAALFAKGDRITPAVGALLASQGITETRVFAPLKAAIISSGNEIVEAGVAAKAHQIYNTNAAALSLALKEAGFEPRYFGISPDDPARLAEILSRAFAECDAVLTTGGVSVGEADFTIKAFEAIGAEIFFHGLNFKPGKPTMAGAVLGKPFFALPGNPLSGAANLYLLVLPALAKLQGGKMFYPNFVLARLASDLAVKGDRQNAILGRFKSGEWSAARGGKYGSGMMTPLCEADSFAVFCGAKTYERGSIVKVLPIPCDLSDNEADFVNK